MHLIFYFSFTMIFNHSGSTFKETVIWDVYFWFLTKQLFTGSVLWPKNHLNWATIAQDIQYIKKWCCAVSHSWESHWKTYISMKYKPHRPGWMAWIKKRGRFFPMEIEVGNLVPLSLYCRQYMIIWIQKLTRIHFIYPTFYRNNLTINNWKQL